MRRALLVAAALAAACAGPDPGVDLPAVGEVRHEGGTAEFPHLRYMDGQQSLNDRCMVRQVKLNPRIAPVYVNGKPVGFC